MACHLGSGGSLIEEHEAFWVEIESTFEPGQARGLQVLLLLLDGVAGFFVGDAVALEEAEQAANTDPQTPFDQTVTQLTQEQPGLRFVGLPDQIGLASRLYANIDRRPSAWPASAPPARRLHAGARRWLG